MTTTEKQKFWRLYKTGSQRKLADWDEGMAIGRITCPVNPGHQRGGRRTTDLSIVLPESNPEDFVWTWGSSCLMQDHVLKLFGENRVTGFEVKPVKARFAKSKMTPPMLWELVVTGWAGMAPPESGIRLNEAKSCSACGLRRYTGLTDSSKLIKPEQWDGSDIFIVWPMAGFIFVTERLRELVKAHRLTGCRFVGLEELRGTMVDKFGADSLSYCMPEKRARELGEPLGIY